MTVSLKLIFMATLILMVSLWDAFDWNNGMTDGYNEAVRRLRHKQLHEGVSLLTQEARNGNAAAQFRLGFMSEFGIGSVHNPHYAQRWYRQAAALSYAPAKERLDLIATEFLKAMPVLDARAKSGEPLALAQLGFAYLYGLGVQESPSLAEVLCQKARTANDAQIEVNILCSRSS